MSDRNVDVGITIRATGGRQASAELNQVRDSVTGAGNASQNASRQFASMGSALTSLSGIIAGLGIAALGRDMLRTVEQVQNMDIRLKGLTKSAQDYAQVQSYLVDVSARHHKSQLALADSFSRLLTLEQSGIITRKQSISLLEGMSNAASKTGATTEQLKQSMFGFSQAMGAGVVHMEELNQVTEPLPGLLNKMAESAGYSVGEFRALVAEGKVTSEVFGKIMVSSFEQYQSAAEAAGETLTAKYADISNAWTQLAAVIEEPVSDVITPVLEGIASVVNGLAQDFRELKQVKDAIFGQSVTGGAPDNGMQIDLTGRAKPPEQANLQKESSAAIRKEIEATAAAHTKAAKTHQAASKVHRAAMSEEEKAAKSLQSAYDSQVKSLLQSLAATKDSSATAAMEYDVTEGALKDLVEAKKLYLLQLTAEIENNKLAQAEKDAQKTEMDVLIDSYNQLTMSAREYYKTKLEGENIKSDAQTPLLKQFDANAQAQAQQKAIDDSRAAFDALVSSSDTANESMQKLSATTQGVFDSTIGGANQLIGTFESMVDSIKQNEVALLKLAVTKKTIDAYKPQNKDEFAKQAEQRKKYELDYQSLQQQTVNSYLDGTRQMAGAAAAMFQDSEDAQLAAQAVALVTLGIQAVQAIVTQGQGDPYTAFARIAAMAAIVGSMVSSVGGKSPGAGSSSMPKGTVSTGTVLGDTSAESNSVGNVYELLKTIHAEEYVELRGINRGVNDLKGGISNTLNRLFQTGGVKDANTSLANFTNVQLGNTGGIVNFDPILNYLLKGIFGTVKEKVIGGGIQTSAFSMGEDVTGQSYTTVEKTKKSWFSKKTSYRTVLSELDQGVEDALTDVFKSMGDTMLGIAGSLGKAIGVDVGKRVSEYIVPSMQIELRGLSGEDAAKKLNGVISAALDTMSNVVFGDIVGQYQKLGEGMLETAIRIVSEVAIVRDALNQSGMTMAGNAIELSDALVQAAGGLEEFQQQFEGFYDKFYTGLEKQNRLQTRLNDTFAEVYMLLPRTREEYRKNMESLNLNNSLDRERYSLMLQLSSAADQYYTSIESGNNDIKNSQSARYEQEIQWLRLSGDEIAAVTLERKREYEAMDASLVPMQKIIDRYGDLINELTDSYNAAADLLTSTFTKFFNLAKSLVQYRDALKVGDLSTGSPESKYRTNKAEFESLRDIIKGGPGKTDASELRYQNALIGLQGASEKFLLSSKDYNASTKNYAKDFNDVMKTLTSGANKSLDIASDSEKQLNALNEMVSGLAKINLSIIKLDGSIGKVDGSIKIVKGSTDKAPSATDALRESINSKTGLKGATDNVTDKVKALNDKSGIKGATNTVADKVKELNGQNGIKGAMGKVGDAVAGLTAAMIEMNALQKERDRIAKIAKEATKKAEDDRIAAQKLLDDQLAAKELAKKEAIKGNIVGKTDLNAMTWLAKNNGVDEATAATYGKSWSDWASGMIGTIDTTQKSLTQLEQLSTLTDDFRGYLAAQAKGQSYSHDGAYYAAEFAKINGSHKDGLNYVPFDGYLAKLHRGERVQTADEARDSDKKANEATKKLLQQVLEELQNANKQRGAVAKETLEKTDKVIANAQAQTRAIKRLQIS